MVGTEPITKEISHTDIKDAKETRKENDHESQLRENKKSTTETLKFLKRE